MLEISKTCKDCGETKPRSEFHIKNKDRKDPHNSRCKTCANKFKAEKMRSGEWKKMTPEESRRRNLQASYGITPDDYNAMFSYQRGCCAICGVHQNEQVGRLCVDHDHSTGEVRGLLCGHCNKGLGHYRDDPELLEIAAEYLRLNGK